MIEISDTLKNLVKKEYLLFGQSFDEKQENIRNQLMKLWDNVNEEYAVEFESLEGTLYTMEIDIKNRTKIITYNMDIISTF